MESLLLDLTRRMTAFEVFCALLLVVALILSIACLIHVAYRAIKNGISYMNQKPTKYDRRKYGRTL